MRIKFIDSCSKSLPNPPSRNPGYTTRQERKQETSRRCGGWGLEFSSSCALCLGVVSNSIRVKRCGIDFIGLSRFALRFTFLGFERQYVEGYQGTDNPIPLPNVSSKILSKVIEYCKYHVENSKNRDDKPATPEDEIKLWDADFVKVDQATLFDLILAANYLNIKNLLDLTCQTVADMIKGKTPEEIRKTFNIKNDFTPEEEEEDTPPPYDVSSYEDHVSLSQLRRSASKSSESLGRSLCDSPESCGFEVGVVESLFLMWMSSLSSLAPGAWRYVRRHFSVFQVILFPEEFP
ncbi:hypothetical protein R1flu_007842 [Riccia fluitans]|uniref:SKP1 component dimerisation domain-containing protein n=1 Tax=Riccia fluitans TaxID=41844 RepID=A0ABD1Z008_9MARC